MAISVKLPVFEGPLDLLLHLIEKNKIDIYDIPIAKITDQYLDYVHHMDHEDMDVPSEFLVMAATLLDIKSRMLLPREADSETGEEEADPREELVRRLLEYKMYKYLSEELSVCREQAGVRYFRARNLPREVLSYQPPIDYGRLLKGTDLNGLKKVFGEVLRRKKSRQDPIRSGFGKIRPEEVNIETKSLYIRAYLKVHPHTDFRALLESQKSREEVIVAFLILLELIKTQKVQIVQDSIGGKILIETIPSDRAPAAGVDFPDEAADVTDPDSDMDATASGVDFPDEAAHVTDPNSDMDATASGHDADKEPDEYVEEPQRQLSVQTSGEPQQELSIQTNGEPQQELSVRTDEGTEKESRPRNTTMPLLAFRGAKVIEAALQMPLLSLTQAEGREPPSLQDKSASVLPETDLPVFQDKNFPSGLRESEPDGFEPEDAPILAVPDASILQETETFQDTCPSDVLPHFSDRLWHGKLPRYSGSGGRRRSGPGTAPSFRGFSGSRRMRGEDPAWGQKRLMRRWGHP